MRSCQFLMRWMRSVSGDIRFVRSYPLASFGRHLINMSVGWTLLMRSVCGLSGSRVVCPVDMRSAPCRYPVCIRWCPFDLSCEGINYRTGNRVRGMSTACAFCDHSTNVMSVSYTVNIRFVGYTSVTLTLVDRSLSVTCSVRMRSLQLPRDFHHRINTFLILEILPQIEPWDFISSAI